MEWGAYVVRLETLDGNCKPDILMQLILVQVKWLALRHYLTALGNNVWHELDLI